MREACARVVCERRDVCVCVHACDLRVSSHARDSGALVRLACCLVGEGKATGKALAQPCNVRVLCVCVRVCVVRASLSQVN